MKKLWSMEFTGNKSYSELVFKYVWIPGRCLQDVVLMGRSPHKKAMERDNAKDFSIVEESLEKVGMCSAWFRRELRQYMQECVRKSGMGTSVR